MPRKRMIGEKICSFESKSKVMKSPCFANFKPWFAGIELLEEIYGSMQVVFIGRELTKLYDTPSNVVEKL